MSAQSPQQGQPTFEEYKVIVEKYEKELELFWPRANFYVLVQAGLLSVVVAVLSAVAVLSKTSSTAGTDSKELLQASAPLFLPAVIGLCLVGLVLGWFWLIVLIGSYGWISVWRTSARKLDKEIRGSHEFDRIEDTSGSRPWRPANVTQYLPLLFITIWTLAGIGIPWITYKFNIWEAQWLPAFLRYSKWVAVLIVLFAIALCIWGHRKRKKACKEVWDRPS